ncbi:hypothetical protein [Paraburkholderia sp. UYCP14C]|uniref:hypothetical protein n=1 Tax=Paraburkholderia sp. UYCP14C TaxID=2511130 RepID=UPI001B7D6DD2|nr:hypothetical protein [Paraburkholderia sp. UYCP14C]
MDTSHVSGVNAGCASTRIHDEVGRSYGQRRRAEDVGLQAVLDLIRARTEVVKQSQRIGPLGKAICMAYHGTDHQP